MGAALQLQLKPSSPMWCDCWVIPRSGYALLNRPVGRRRYQYCLVRQAGIWKRKQPHILALHESLPAGKCAVRSSVGRKAAWLGRCAKKHVNGQRTPQLEMLYECATQIMM
ncbi:hypothetical protein ABBQ38_005877 [Trebouxia sp. C0009 RCD-2024]